MPGKQTFLGQRIGKMPGGIEHHFNNPLDMPVNRYKSADIESQSAGDRRPHLVFIQLFTFDFAGFENILGQSLK